MTKRLWWQKPKLRTDEEHQRSRKVSWLELFFDLFFVVVISKLSHNLAKDISLAGVSQFIFLFIPIWWVWIGIIYYNERFETEGIEHRLFTFMQMLPVAGLAVFAEHGLGETSIGFALSYVVARAIITFLWWRGGYHEKSFRPTSRRFVTGMSIAIALFVVSIFVPPPERFILWGIGLLIEIITPIFTIKHQTTLPKFSTSKLPERLGLFIIIVLGESVVGVVEGLIVKEHISPLTFLTGVLSMALVFGLWCVYFDFVACKPPKSGVGWAFLWGYSHMPLVIGLTATGAGILNVLAHRGTIVPSRVRLLITGSLALSLAIIGLLETTLQREENEHIHSRLSPVLKLITSAVAGVLNFWGRGLGAIALLSILLVLVVLQIGYSFLAWLWL